MARNLAPIVALNSLTSTSFFLDYSVAALAVWRLIYTSLTDAPPDSQPLCDVFRPLIDEFPGSSESLFRALKSP